MTLQDQAAYTARLILPDGSRGMVTYYLDVEMREIGYEINGTGVKTGDTEPWGSLMRRGYEIKDIRSAAQRSLDKLLEV